MADHVADVVESLELVELSGQRHTAKKAESLSLAVELQGQRSEEEPRHVALRADVRLVKAESDDDPEPELFYRGAAQYLLILKEGHEEVDSDVLVELVWPYFRSSLLDQARAVGFRALKLPLGIRSRDIDETPPAWMRGEATGEGRPD